jgi:hypothetical protein
VRIVELSIAVIFVIAGLRSLWKWSRLRFESTDVTDHALYATFVTGRVGLWFAFAGFFLIYASVDVRGKPAVDELQQYRWYLIVPLVLAAMQFAGGWFLGRRQPPERDRGPSDG